MPPATEKTWRDQRVMHIVFGVSALIMTVATLWLFAKDHNREWKRWQLTDRKKDAWMIQAQRDRSADIYSSQMKQHEETILDLESQPIDAVLIAEFKQAVKAEQLRASGGDQPVPSVSDFLNVEPEDEEFPDLAAEVAELNETATAVNDAAVGLEQAGADPDADLQRKLQSAKRAAKAKRDDVLSEMQTFIREAKRVEGNLVARKKTENGKRTAAVSELGLLNAHGGSAEAAGEKQRVISALDAQIKTLTEQIATAKNYRVRLEEIVNQINAARTEQEKELSRMQVELSRLDEQVAKNTSNVGEWITRWPVLNALYDGNIRIDQNWLPDLTINFNFSQAARFDRCTTCHRAISKAAPGTATDPAYPTIPDEQRDITAFVATPADKPADDSDLRDVYGLVLSEQGVIDLGEVTVHYTLPDSPAALAGLQSGDVVVAVGDAPVYDAATATSMLLRTYRSWGQPVELQIRRGLDHPFTTHPRLDLYLTDLSPHPQKVVGCTICHDGQGSGTDFKWTSHTPDNARQHNKWIREYGWFDNHHWIFPMKPDRFVESNCLKCHHEKGGLEPSERFPEPPAPKLVEGWTAVEKFGCYGCHEINGYDGPDRRIGPDARLEPAYHEAAAQLLRDAQLTDEERGWAETLVGNPENDSARQLLAASVTADQRLATRSDTAGEARLSSESHNLAAVLKDVETPGAYRKVGPSLRYLGSKVDFEWIYSWIRKPSDFRPSTRMPQIFGLWEHLEGQGLEESQKFEPIEIRAVAEYLLNNSGEFQYLNPPERVTEEADVKRGAWLFETRGCLACHAHDEFGEVTASQGPNLSRIAAKFDNPKGRQWLYSWIKQPHKYHPRTKMPDLYLDPIDEKDAKNQPTGVITDPAADIVAYLLSIKSEWQPTDVPSRELTAEEEIHLEELALQWLASDQIPEETAAKFLKSGIPDKFAKKVKEDERILIGMTPENRNAKLLHYVGRRTIAKHGCFGCHDIPGYETAKPIGTAMADWGRKDTSKLAFENIQAFLTTHGLDPTMPGEDHAHPDQHVRDHGDEEHGGHGGHGLDPIDFSDDESYFIQAINSHQRDGFIWQKLRHPRSYDYKTTDNKGYNERLRMPKFPLTEEQREAVITFVLGLVNEPPAEKYVYQPDARQKAIVEGRGVLEKYNCAGCHTLKMEQWEFAYEEDAFDSPSTVTDFPFLDAHFSRTEIEESLVKDSRGLRSATLHGLPVIDETTGKAQLVDEDGLAITREEVAEIFEEDGEVVPTFYTFTLWRDALLNGEPWLRGVQDVLIPAAEEGVGPDRGAAYPAWGGDLARYLFPKVIAKAQEANPQVKGSEAWGWLPPPLMDEGEKVQPDWLHGFLMDPTALRPAVVMRMPNFHMSSDDASKLVNYFAAASGAEFPYEYRPQQRSSYLARLEQERDDPLGEAMNIVVNGNYCVKCHGVADFMPIGDATALGPNLADVSRRLRPSFVRDWIANPKRILPYTGMPVNIPYKADAPHLGGVSQDLFKGDSTQQLGGLVDLLMNFDAYALQQTSVSSLVKEAPAPAAGDDDISAAAP